MDRPRMHAYREIDDAQEEREEDHLTKWVVLVCHD